MKPHPISDAWPLMDADAYASLLASVRAHGVKVPLWKYAGMILDGRNRYRAAKEAGLLDELEWHEFTGTEEQARDLAELLNDERRAPRTREERRAVVAKLRGQGLSTRAIADVVKVSKDTVARDLQAGVSCETPAQPEDEPDVPNEPDEPESDTDHCDSGGAPGATDRRPTPSRNPVGPSAAATETAPSKVTGKDGKTYPATRKATAKKPEAAPKAQGDAGREKETKLRGQAIEIAHEAMNALKRLSKSNPFRSEAFRMVRKFMRDNP
jgi:hypothetical protein